MTGVRALPAPGTARRKSWLPWLAGLAVLTAAGIWLMPEHADEDPPAVAARQERSTATPPATRAAPMQIGFTKRATSAMTANLFPSHSWFRAPPPVQIKQGPPPAPTAPPFPYTYFGQYERSGDKTVYILQKGDRVFDVRIGEVLDGVWSIDGEQGGQIQLTYTPLKLKQALPVGSMK